MARPLEKAKRGGPPYTRPPEIEAAIDLTLGQDLETVCRRAGIRDSSLKHYLPSECLVHVVRQARRNGDEAAAAQLLPLLLDRCNSILLSKVASSLSGAAELREDILGEFSELFALDGSPQDRHQLDFFEVRFNNAFATFRITRVRQELRRIKRTDTLPDDSALRDVRIDPAALAMYTGLRSTTSDPENAAFRKELHTAISSLPLDERRALVLCKVLGLKEESENPNEQTAATLCKVTGRTIRNRLARALARLSRLKENA